MKFSRIFSSSFLAVFLFTSPLFAQENPEAVYAKWVAASKAGDIQGLLAISSAAKVKEFDQEYSSPEKKEEIRKLMKLMAPLSYQVKKTDISSDGNKASLTMDVTALDFFEMNDPKAKPRQENAEVRLVKESGAWKIDQQCMGKDGCGKEPEWQKVSWGKIIPLSNQATVKFVKGKASIFKGVSIKGQAFVGEMVLNFPDGSETVSYFLHRSPNFADFFVKAGEAKITPSAQAEDFPATVSSDPVGPQVKVLEEGTSYSQNRNFQGSGSVALLFDLPKDAKGSIAFYATLTYAGKKYEFEVK